MRSRRKSRLNSGLTRAQEWWLIHGARLSNNNPFDDPAAERRAWQAHKERLTSKYHLPPGCRPRGWWIFDSHANSASLPDFFVTPVQELGFRLQSGLIAEPEAAEVETHYAVLNPAFCDALTDCQTIAALRLSTGTLRHLLRDAQISQRWHSWRGRPEHAEKYRQLAATMRGLIEETNQSAERIFS
jgi:hypothetical protein